MLRGLSRSLLSLLVLVLLAPAPLAAGGSHAGPAPAPAQPSAAPTQPSAAPTGVALVAGTLVDLTWDPTQYPIGTSTFLRWELWRKPSGGSSTVIAGGTDQTTNFYRDTGPLLNYNYNYTLVIWVRAPGGQETSSTIFSSNTGTLVGQFKGWVTRNLVLPIAEYTLGWAVTVEPGVSLTIGPGVVILPGENPRIETTGGNLVINGAHFLERAGATSCIGLYLWDATGSVSNTEFPFCTMLNLEGNSAGWMVQHVTGKLDVIVADQASATVQESSLASAGATGTASLTVSECHLSVGGGAGGNATATYIQTTFEPPAGGTVGIGSGYINTSGRTVLQASKVISGSLDFWETSTLDMQGTLVVGSMISLWEESKGQITGNTIRDGQGIYVYGTADRPALTISGNCIEGNAPGLDIHYASRTTKLDVTHNWWGSASGPNHPTNPSGAGDPIVGDQVTFDPWDTTTDHCFDAPPVEGITIVGRAYVPGLDYPLIGALATVRANGAEVARAVTQAPDGRFELADIPATSGVQLVVQLEHAAKTPPTFSVLYHEDATHAWYAAAGTTPFDTTGMTGSLERDLPFGDVPGILPGSGVPAETLDDLGAMYYHLEQAWELTDLLGQPLDLSLPVMVYAYSDEPSVFWSGPTTDNNIPGLQPRISVNWTGSDITDSDRPENREWHEFGHHVMADTFGNLMPGDPSNVNHAGYANNSTTDSWDEGFAEFFSMMVAREVAGDVRPEIYTYADTQENMEANRMAWTLEEFAAAGLLLDLVDPVDALDASTMGTFSYADCVTMPLADLWEILATDWGNQAPKSPVAPADYGYLFDAKHLYDVLKLRGVGAAHSRAFEWDDLDELFISHGFFADVTAPYESYSLGEAIGRAADAARPDRRDVTVPAGSYLAYDAIVDETGAPVEVTGFRVEVRFAAPFEHLGYAYGLSAPADTPGRLALYGPDPQYAATIYVTALAPGLISSAPLAIDNADYWAQMATHPPDHFASHTFEMVTRSSIYLPLATRLAAAGAVGTAGAAYTPNACVPYALSGHVYAGTVGDTSHPLAGADVALTCSASADAPGALLVQAKTDASGAYSLPVRAVCAYYNLVETDPAGYTSVAAQSAGGTVRGAGWIQYRSPLAGKALGGNNFWDKTSSGEITVEFFDGDVFTYADPPDVTAYCNTEYRTPPPGVTISDSGDPFWRYYGWVSLLEEGQWIAASYSQPVTALGVQFWGGTSEGWARVLVDGAPVWSGSVWGDDAHPFKKYMQVSGLPAGPHTIRVENMGIPGQSGGWVVTMWLFGFGPAAP